MLNWRRDPAYEQRKMQHEQRMKQLENEIAASKQRTKRLESEIEQLAAIESRLVRFEQEHSSNSNPLSSTGDSSPS